MANIKQITLNGTTYNIYDSSAVHTVDAALSSSSTNPVQNKVVKAALDTKGTIIDLGTKTNTSTAGYYTFTVSSTDATALATTHDGIRILCGSGSAYRPSEYLIAFKNGTTAVNGVASTIYTGTVGNADFTSKTVAIVIPTSTSGTGYIQEGECDIDIDELMNEFLFDDEAVSDKDVFLTRQTNHGGATQMYPTMIGATMAWNQLQVKTSPGTQTQNDLTITNNNDGSWTLNGTPTARTIFACGSIQGVANHKYFVRGCLNLSYHDSSWGGINTSRREVAICNNTTTGNIAMSLDTETNYSAAGTFTNKKIYLQITDITLALTPAIADYAYSLEQSTAGSGIAWLQSHGFFTKDYYPNNAGSLQSVNPSASRSGGYTKINTNSDFTAGKNPSTATVSYNSSTDTFSYSATIPSAGYGYAQKFNVRPPLNHVAYMGAYVIGSSGMTSVWFKPCNSTTTPTTYPTWSGAGNYGAIQKVTNTSGGSTLIGVSAPNGTSVSATFQNIIIADLTVDLGETLANQIYALEQANTGAGINRLKEIGYFDPRTYPISQTELRGVYKLDSSNNLYADGDIRHSDGRLERKYGISTFNGTENWQAYNGAFYLVFSGYKRGAGLGYDIARSNMFLYMGQNQGISSLISSGRGTFAFRSDENVVQIYPTDTTLTTAALFKTWLSSNPVTIIYELATPTTESVPAFQSPQVIYDGGTQTYVDTRDVPVPVGQEATYMSDSRSTLQQIVNTPTTDGKYHLVSNVTGGTPEYVWESNTSSDFYASIAGGTGVGLSATIDSFSFYTGVSLILKLTSDATNSNGITLAINDGHGTSYSAKSITYQGDAIKMLAGNRAYTLAYNGTSFDIVGDLNNLHYCECIDSAGTIAKSAGGTHGFVLKRGQVVEVWFANGNTATGSLTLNIGGTGAKSIMQYGSTNITGLALASGAIVTFVYDGTYWRVVSISDKSGVPVWGLSTNGAAVYPYAKASDSDVSSGNVVVLGDGVDASAVKIGTNRDGNIVTMCSTTMAIAGTPAAGSTSYTLNDSNSVLPDGTYDYLLEYYFSIQGENVAAQKPISVTLDSSNRPVLTFASTLNPTAAASNFQYGANIEASGLISSAGGVCCTKSWNILAGNFITSKGQGSIVAAQKAYNTGGVSALIGARLKNTANYSLLVGSDNLNAKAYSVLLGQGHDSTNGSAAMMAIGKYSNITSTSAFVIGNGTATSARSNAFEVCTDAQVNAYGNLNLRNPSTSWTSPPSLLIHANGGKVAKVGLTENGQNLDAGWEWTSMAGAGMAFRSKDFSNASHQGAFVFFARKPSASDPTVAQTAQLYGFPNGVLQWNGRRVVTSTEATAVGSSTSPVYIDANGYPQLCSLMSQYASLRYSKWYGTCDTAATTAAKVVTIADGANFSLTDGATVSVKFNKGSAASVVTLNVNSTGAKTAIRSIGADGGVTPTYDTIDVGINPGSIYDFVFDSTAMSGSGAWVLITPVVLQNLNQYSNRLTNVNRSVKNGGLEYILASSATTTGKPPVGAAILNMNWDYGTKYGAQLAVAYGDTTEDHGPGGRIFSRGQDSSTSGGTWSSWYEVPRFSSTPSNGQPLVYDTTLGAGFIKGGTIDASNISVQSTATVATSDQIAIADASDSYKLKNMGISFDTGTNYTQYMLTKRGTWELPKEAYLQWGGKNLSANNSPLDAALINTLGADRFAFIPAACTTVEYSTDAGATWQDYGLSDGSKLAIFGPGLGTAVYLGKHTTAGSGTTNDQLRITVDTYSGSQKVYSTIKKFVMYGSTNGAANTTWSLQVRTTANVLNNVDTWVNVFTDVAWGGWSGINIAQTDVTIGSNAPTSTSNTQYRQFRLIFKQGAPNASYGSSAVSYIMGYGGVGWATPSNMAKLGSIYTYDYLQNVAFPARVKATELKGLGANYYGVCDTAAATAAKVVTCTDFVLTTGARISVKFTNGSTSTSTMTLNVNSTGAKNCGIYLYNNTWQSAGNRCEKNEVLEFIYNGTYWITLTPYALRNYYNYNSRATSANVSLANGGLQYFLATSSMTTGKPSVDSHILNMNWDNGQNYAAQLAVAHGGNTSATESYAGRLFARGQRMGDGTWSTWYEFPRYSVLPSDGDIIVSEDAAGAARVKGLSTLPSSKITADQAYIQTGDALVIASSNNSWKLARSTSSFDVSDANSYLCHNGDFVKQHMKTMAYSGATYSTGWWRMASFDVSDSSLIVTLGGEWGTTNFCTASFAISSHRSSASAQSFTITQLSGGTSSDMRFTKLRVVRSTDPLKCYIDLYQAFNPSGNSGTYTISVMGYYSSVAKLTPSLISDAPASGTYAECEIVNGLSATTIYEGGTSLTNKYAVKAHTHTLDQVYNDSTTEGRTVASGDRILIASVGGSDSSGVVKSPSTLAFTSDTSQFLRHDGTFAEPVLSGANVTVTSTAAKATNDVIPIADASDSYKLKNMSITLDTSDTATFLCHDGSWSTPYYIRTIGDQRSTGTTPNTYKNQLAFLGLKGKATINNPSTDTYSYLLGLRGWSDSSGGNAWELAFNNTGIFARTGATTTWGNWQQLMTSTNYNTWASPKSHTHTLDQVYNDSTTASRTVESGDRILIASMGGSDSSGLVKSPSALALGSDTTKFLCNNGTWAIPGNVILSYGSSTWQDFIDAYNANRVIYCRASSNTDPATGSQTRMAFMAYVDDGTTPTNVEFQYYRSVATHSNTQQGDEVYVYKLTNAGAWTVTKRQAYTKIVAGTNMSSSYSSGTLTLSATNTDTKVTQTAITGTSTTNFYPILLAKSTGQTADTTDTANFTADASVTPSGDIYSVNMVVTESFKYGANAHTTYNSTLKAIEFIFD